MVMLKWMFKHTKRNKDIQDKVGVTSMVDKMSEALSMWTGDV